MSNFLRWKDGIVQGFDTEKMIHVFNKNETALEGTDYNKLVHDRTSIIVMGDSLGDAGMADGSPATSNVLKIGFLHENVSNKIWPFFHRHMNMINVNYPYIHFVGWKKLAHFVTNIHEHVWHRSDRRPNDGRSPCYHQADHRVWIKFSKPIQTVIDKKLYDKYLLNNF